jgi:hypothetical protein
MAKHPQPMTGKGMEAFKIILLAAIAGLLLGLGLDIVKTKGYLTQWQKFVSPTAEDFSLIGAVESTVYMETVDGIYYRCHLLDLDTPSECTEIVSEHVPWQLIQDTSSFAYARNIKPCDTSSTEFLFNSHKEFMDCIQVDMNYEDGSGRGAYVLDKNKELWGWFHIGYTGSYYPLEFLLYRCGGILIGIVTGLMLIRYKQRHKVGTTPTAFGVQTGMM